MRRPGASRNGSYDYLEDPLSKVFAEEFVRTWQTSKTRAEVARRLGKSLEYVSMNAGRLRAKGVPLKVFRRGSETDWAALAELAKTLEANHG